MKNVLITSTLLLLITLSSCDWFSAEEPTEIELDPKSATIVESNNTFGYSFFENIIETEEPGKNVMISPLSISQALSMTLNGAEANTLTQMKQVLGFDNFSLADLNQSNKTITASLVNHDPKVKLSIANSIWYRNDFSPKRKFIDDNVLYYSAKVSSYDPSNPNEAKEKINSWVDDKTNGKIKEIIEEVTSENVMFLINAVYFKAQWSTEFKKNRTEDAPFTLDSGSAKEVKTMKGDVKLAYLNEEEYSLIKVPYGAGKYNLLIYLPEEGFTTIDIVNKIEATDFSNLANLPLSERELWLPKFEFSYENKLNDELINLGMTDAFNPSLSNFSGISDIGLYISEVKHKTYIKTDEEGSEAAAATSVTMDFTSIGPEGIILVNRSFLFAIVEEDTHSILFMGRVYDPSVKE